MQIDFGEIVFSHKDQLEKNNENKHLVVTNCGYFIIHNKRDIFKQENDNNDYLLIYQHSGDLKIKTTGDYVDVTQGNVILIQPNAPRDIIYLANETNERYFVYFKGSHVENILKQLGLSDKIILPTGNMTFLIETFHKLINDFKNHDFNNDIYREYYLTKILIEIARCFHRSLSPVTENPISNVLAAMDKEYYRNYPLSYYVDIANMSNSTFLRHFKKTTGLSPITFLNNIKIEKAKVFLSSTDLSVSEIAFSVGISDPLYFSSFFKKNTGVTPSKFRSDNKFSD